MVERYSNYIAGSWTEGEGWVENINPSDVSDTIGQYAQASAVNLDDALGAARQAMKEWQNTRLEHRQAVLSAVGREMMARSAELGELLSREEGKPRAEGVGEVYRAGQFFDYYAAEVLRLHGETADSVRPDIEVDIRREPMGVVGVISPWNFPVATASWKIAPALAFGNAVIWKPANATPASAWALAEIFSRQDIPPGLFNLVMGGGSKIGLALSQSPKIDAISFTGSQPVGCQVAAAAVSNLTKVQLELGSKNALVVMDDADMDVAVSAAAGGAYGGTGQKCTASSRLVVHRAVHDEFVERLSMAVESLVVGPALAEGTQMGPVVSAGQLAANQDYVALAGQEGCELAAGGGEPEIALDGYYMNPLLFIGGRNDMRINREEIFGPMACVIPADDYDHALAITNDTEFGLTAGIVTKSLARANHFRRNAEVGCVMVNLPTAGTDYHVPFGGRKGSSFGSREQGRYAAEFYTQVKTAYISAGNPA